VGTLFGMQGEGAGGGRSVQELGRGVTHVRRPGNIRGERGGHQHGGVGNQEVSLFN